MKLLVITILAGVLRFLGLGSEPLWVDEALFAFWVRDGGNVQEFLPVWIALDTSEFGLRFFSALCGTLTIPAVYLVTKNIKASLFVAVFPLFVFWSQMARPYAIAGLFVVLGYRYWWVYVAAILSTPIAAVGMNIKHPWYVLAALVLFAAWMFFLREDSGRAWHFSMLLNHTRFWYVPILAGVLYWSDYAQPLFQSHGRAR